MSWWLYSCPDARFPLTPLGASVYCCPQWRYSELPSGGRRLCCYVMPHSISICTLTVCLALTAGLCKLITVNCVPPLHNQLICLRPVRCAHEGYVRVCPSMPTVFSVQYETQWIWAKIHYNLYCGGSWSWSYYWSESHFTVYDLGGHQINRVHLWP